MPSSRICLVVLAVAVFACARTGDEATSVPVEASVCQLVAEPESYLGRPVSLTTRIEADGMHWALLMGPKCHRGLFYNHAGSVPTETQEAISKAIFEPWPGTRGKTIEARFTGVLRRDREDGISRKFPYYFEISRVENLNIKIGQRP